MKLRALLVEDDLDQLDGLELAFHSIPEAKRRRYGIDDISVEKTDCAQLAREKLEWASRSSDPYDILLQDLNLPNKPGGKEEGVQVGHGLLEFAHEQKAAKEIGVVSAKTDFDSVSMAFLRGAVDFIPKPSNPDDLQRCILQLWERRLLKESARIFENRLKTLIPSDQSEFIYRVSSSFSELDQAILRKVESMKRSFSERFGLDAQSDTLFTHLQEIRQAVHKAQGEWAETRGNQHLFVNQLPAALADESEQVQLNPDSKPADAPDTVFIEDALRKAVSQVSSCLIIKRVIIENIPDERDMQVTSFGADVQTVLKEIILGAINELPDQNNLSKDIRITVNRIEKNGKAEVRFEDNLDHIPGFKAEKVNAGKSLPPDDGFGRAWGLSVVHRVALRGGGSLNVRPSEQGNVITYFIPLAKNA